MSVVALILLLFAATAALRALADRAGIPLPTLLVLGGLAVALIPGLPRLTLDPATIFLIFIPPLLYWTSLSTSLRDLRRNLRSITLLALWLVLLTMAVVAVVMHALVPQLPWAMCFVLGAIVSPPDAIAVTASTRSLSLPRTALVILEGESLMNDATAIVAYQIALAAAVSGTFSLPHAAGELLFTGIGGIAVGIGLGWCVGWVRAHMRRSGVVENTLSLLSPFIAFIPASALGCSGVMAVVAMGLYLARFSPRVVSAATRLQATAMWEMLTFLLEGLIFIFIGLELPQVVEALQLGSAVHLAGIALVVVAAMIVTRIFWMFVGAYGPRWLERRLGRPSSAYPPWRNVLFLGWAGIRGGDSLVIALALPYIGLHGTPLPGRSPHHLHHVRSHLRHAGGAGADARTAHPPARHRWRERGSRRGTPRPQHQHPCRRAGARAGGSQREPREGNRGRVAARGLLSPRASHRQVRPSARLRTPAPDDAGRRA